MKTTLRNVCIGFVSLLVAFGTFTNDRVAHAFLEPSREQNVAGAVVQGLWGVIMNFIYQNSSQDKNDIEQRILGFYKSIYDREMIANQPRIKSPQILKQELELVGRVAVQIEISCIPQDPDRYKQCADELYNKKIAGRVSVGALKIIEAWIKLDTNKRTDRQNAFYELFQNKRNNPNKKPLNFEDIIKFYPRGNNAGQVTEFFDECNRIGTLFEKRKRYNLAESCEGGWLNKGIQLSLKSSQRTRSSAAGQQLPHSGTPAKRSSSAEEHICDRVLRELSNLDHGLSLGYAPPSTVKRIVPREILPVLSYARPNQVRTLSYDAALYKEDLSRLEKVKEELKEHSYNVSELHLDLEKDIKNKIKDTEECKKIDEKLKAIRDEVRATVKKVKNIKYREEIFHHIFNTWSKKMR